MLEAIELVCARTELGYATLGELCAGELGVGFGCGGE